MVSLGGLTSNFQLFNKDHTILYNQSLQTFEQKNKSMKERNDFGSQPCSALVTVGKKLQMDHPTKVFRIASLYRHVIGLKATTWTLSHMPHNY